MPKDKISFDIFCQVIDNLGDIGVSYRLAKILVQEYNCEINLFVDNLSAFAKIEKRVLANIAMQKIGNINVYLWDNNTQLPKPSNVVIETFGCTLPQNYLHCFTQTLKQKRPIWINLEYLSAEKWVEDCHCHPSPQSINNSLINKYFFFPGFSANTGGVNYEKNIFNHSQSWCKRHSQIYFEKNFNINLSEYTQTMLLFIYKNLALPTLLNYLINAQKKSLILIPYVKDDYNLQVIKNMFCVDSVSIGKTIKNKNLDVLFFDFVAQEDFDKLLWSSDINFVRGEDSLVRGLIAGKVLVWQIYQQSENTHITKLQAFLDNYLTNLPTNTAQTIRQFFLSWNQQKTTEAELESFLKTQKEINLHNLNYQKVIQTHKSLAENITTFINTKLSEKS